MEFVYVVKRYDLFERSFPHGLELLGAAARAPLEQRIRAHGFFVERRHAELDSSFKQVIPYCLVVRRGEVFLMRRLAGGGEARLHGKRTVGVGGHINPVDGMGAGDDVVAEGLRRARRRAVRAARLVRSPTIRVLVSAIAFSRVS